MIPLYAGEREAFAQYVKEPMKVSHMRLARALKDALEAEAFWRNVIKDNEWIAGGYDGWASYCGY